MRRARRSPRRPGLKEVFVAKRNVAGLTQTELAIRIGRP